MKSGVSFPSYTRDATWSVGGGGADADFPATNLGNLEEVRKVYLASAAGARNPAFVMPASKPVDFVAVVHHNADAAATFRLQLSSGITPGADIVYDSGVVPFWPAGVIPTDFLQVRPILLPAAVTTRSGRLLLSATAAPWEIGAIEVGQFWKWEDVAVPRALGIDSRAIAVDMSRGAAHVMRQWAPRTVSGSREVVLQTELDGMLLDFQRAMGLHKPFVWCEDAEDAATWPRQCMVVTNESLPAGSATDYEVGRLGFSFVEHLR